MFGKLFLLVVIRNYFHLENVFFEQVYEISSGKYKYFFFEPEKKFFFFSDKNNLLDVLGDWATTSHKMFETNSSFHVK